MLIIVNFKHIIVWKVRMWRLWLFRFRSSCDDDWHYLTTNEPKISIGSKFRKLKKFIVIHCYLFNCFSLLSKFHSYFPCIHVWTISRQVHSTTINPIWQTIFVVSHLLSHCALTGIVRCCLLGVCITTEHSHNYYSATHTSHTTLACVVWNYKLSECVSFSRCKGRSNWISKLMMNYTFMNDEESYLQREG